MRNVQQKENETNTKRKKNKEYFYTLNHLEYISVYRDIHTYKYSSYVDL